MKKLLLFSEPERACELKVSLGLGFKLVYKKYEYLDFL
jgi:hypothetical protein